MMETKGRQTLRADMLGFKHVASPLGFRHCSAFNLAKAEMKVKKDRQPDDRRGDLKDSSKWQKQLILMMFTLMVAQYHNI